MSKKKHVGYSFSWTQPYGYSQWHEGFNRMLDITEELRRLDAADVAVQNMLTYPDAERIINSITAGEYDD